MKTAFVYSTDENYVKLTAVSVYSLIKHNPGAAIIVLANEVSVPSANFLKTLVTSCGGSFEIIDVAEKLSHIKSLGASGYTSYSTYARFFIAELIGNRFNRVVYIDSDTLIVGSLDPLTSFDLEGKTFAIGYDCIHTAYKKLIGLPQDKPYYNAGILLIDVKEWARRKCAQRVFDYMRNVRASFLLGDQDFFSLVLSSDAKALPPQYDFLTHFQLFTRAKDAIRATGINPCCWYSAKEFAAAQETPVIHHFLGHTLGRPWFKESKNPLRPLFIQFAKEAGVPEIAEQSRPLDFCYRVQWLCWKFLPRPFFVIACRAMYAYFFKTSYGV